MIEKLCKYLTKEIRKRMPEVDDARAEIIEYGLQLVIGEIPKIFILIGIAIIAGVIKETLICMAAIIPYKMLSGGVHLKTHIGCIITTNLLYLGNVYLSQYIIIENPIYKYILIIAVWIFSMIMIKLYAPADTEEAPILRAKERKFKKRMSYLVMTITLIVRNSNKKSSHFKLIYIWCIIADFYNNQSCL